VSGADLKAKNDAIDHRLTQLRHAAQRPELDPYQRKILTEQADAADVEGKAEKAYNADQAQRAQQRDRMRTTETITSIRNTGNEMAMRATSASGMGNESGADLAAKNNAIDERVQKMKDAAAAENDTVKKRQLEEIAAAGEKEGAAEKEMNNEDAKRAKAVGTLNAIASERKAQSAIARGDYNADLAAFEAAWDAKLKKIKDTDEYANALRQRAAEKTVMEARHADEMEDIANHTKDQALRAAQRGPEADVAAVQEKYNRQIKEAGTDQAKVLALKKDEYATLLNMASASAVRGSFTSFADYHFAEQEGIFGGNQAAGDAAEKLDKAASKMLSANVMVLQE